MIDDNGIRRTVITAAQARQISGDNPPDDNNVARADLMAYIERVMMRGGNHLFLHDYRCYYDGKMQYQMPQVIIDWLVSLGYVVYHHKTDFVNNARPNRRAYTIYWRYDQGLLDAGFVFSPGEMFSPDYKDADEVGCGAV
jgi:SMC interacting uncharacterized protein involved in chromosome segregation